MLPDLSGLHLFGYRRVFLLWLFHVCVLKFHLALTLFICEPWLKNDYWYCPSCTIVYLYSQSNKHAQWPDHLFPFISDLINVQLLQRPAAILKKTWITESLGEKYTQTNPEISWWSAGATEDLHELTDILYLWRNLHLPQIPSPPKKSIGRQQRYKAFRSPKCFKAKIPLNALMWKVKRNKVSARKSDMHCPIQPLAF